MRFDDEATGLQALISGQIDLVGTGLLVNRTLNRNDPGKNYEVKIVLRAAAFRHRRPPRLDRPAAVAEHLRLHHQEQRRARRHQPQVARAAARHLAGVLIASAAIAWTMSSSSAPSGRSRPAAARHLAHRRAVGPDAGARPRGRHPGGAGAHLSCIALLRGAARTLRRGHSQHAVPGPAAAASISACRPSGIRLAPDQAALLAMVVNLGAYATEIVRAGIEAVPQRPDRGRPMRSGSPRPDLRTIVMIMPALRTVFPALGSQFILVMLASSVVSVISAEELTAVADTIVARNFRSFEFYFIVTGIYLALSLFFQPPVRACRPLAVPLAGARHMIREFTSTRRGSWCRPRAGPALSPFSPSWAAARGIGRRAPCASQARGCRAPPPCLHPLFQGTPLLMQLYPVYFGANLLGLQADAWRPQRWGSRSTPAPSWARSGAAASRRSRADNGTARGRWP